MVRKHRPNVAIGARQVKQAKSSAVVVNSTTDKPAEGAPERSMRSDHNNNNNNNHSELRIIELSEKDRRSRKRALDLLRGLHGATEDSSIITDQQKEFPHKLQHHIEFPVLYAALKRIKEIGTSLDEKDSDLTDDDRHLIHDANLAVPYVMYKRFYEHLMLPRTMGGLAFSDAKAKQVARDIFLALGPACCKESITDQELAEACPSVKRSDAMKILPSLKAVGREARSQVEQIEALLNEGAAGDDEEEFEDEDEDEDESEESSH